MPRLLLVDDNPSIHKIAESLLIGSDVQLVSAEDGAHALALLNQGDAFDVALVDIYMGGMDGWSLLEALRMHPATSRLPVALMAGVLDQVDMERLEAARVQGFIKKPVELKDLSSRVHELIAAGVPSEGEPTVAMRSPYATAPAMKVSDLAALTGREEVAADDLLLLTDEDLLFPPTEDEDEVSDSPEVPHAETGSLELAPEAAIDLDAVDLDEGDLVLSDLSDLSAPEESSQDEPLDVPAEMPAVDLLAVPAEQVDESWGIEEPRGGNEIGTQAPEESSQTAPEDPAILDELIQPLTELPEVEDASPAIEPSVEPDPMEMDLELELGEPEGLELESEEELQLETSCEVPAEDSVTAGEVELPDLGEDPADVTPVVALLENPVPDAEPIPENWADESDDLLSAIQAALPTTTLPELEEAESAMPSTEELVGPSLESGVGAALAAGALAAAGEQIAENRTQVSPELESLVQALLNDPESLAKLARALAPHLSQEALREVAWEVMPDLADRLRPY